jgi:hypothetical protein
MNAEDGQTAVVSWTDAEDDVRRSYTLPMRRALLWRQATGGESHVEAAEHAGVTDRQVRRWLQRLDFKRDWDDPASWLKREVRSSRGSLEYKALLAAHLLLDDAQTPATVRADVIGKALTDARQERARETAPASAGLSAYLAELGRESAAILKEERDLLDGGG